jgi:hypothetical protein
MCSLTSKGLNFIRGSSLVDSDDNFSHERFHLICDTDDGGDRRKLLSRDKDPQTCVHSISGTNGTVRLFQTEGKIKH